MVFLYLSVVIVIVNISVIGALPVERSAGKTPFGFDDVVASNKFPLKGFNGTWISDTEFVYRNAESNIIRYSVPANTHTLFFNADLLNQWTSPSWTLSPDNAKLLIRHNVTQVFRHSIVASYVIYDIASQQTTDIADRALLSLCQFSPNSQHIVYVLDNDVYQLRSLRTSVRLTSDGVVGVVYNGVPDWVYEEEVFGSGGALWVAPNGARLVIASFDDRAVEEFTYITYGDLYETEVKLRYPKVGRRNPAVRLRHIDLSAELIEWQVIEAPVDIVSADHILKSVSWINDRTFGVIWMNRRQNRSVFQQCDAVTNVCANRFETAEPTGWVDLSQLTCTVDGDRCFYMDWVGNWQNIYEYIPVTGARRVLIEKAFTVLAIYGYNKATEEIYYLATTTTSPHERHVYKNDECLTCQLSFSANKTTCTYASASFSRSFAYFAVTCSGPAVPYTFVHRTSDNIKIIEWEGNRDTHMLLQSFAMPRIEYLRVPLSDGHLAAVKLIIPAELGELTTATATTPTTSNHTYPMVVDVYGGPNSVRVTDTFSLGYKMFLVSTRQVIYCQIDGRGSGNKGRDLLFTVNNRLGTVEIADQIAVTRHLQRSYAGVIDAKRTAIWGWSYGGYATAHVLRADRDKVFQCGISVAPVSSWLYYDSIYTERYMGLPTEADNLRGYLESDISANVTASALGQHEYMLVHGNADDNVHYQNALVFTAALVEADVDFQQVNYPNEAHGLSGVQKHLYHTIDRFWAECLGL